MSGRRPRAAQAAGPPRAATTRPGRPGLRHELRWAILLLALHAGLALWGAVRNSVTFDENFHLPSGVLIARHGELRVSAVNPPLVKALCGWAALAAGARIPTAEAMGDGEQGRVGEAFMRANADRYHRVFVAARTVVIGLSLLLGLVVWRWARRRFGPRGGLLALAFYAFAPEALAHAGVVTLDLATALGFAASAYAFWGFARSGRWTWWLGLVAAVGGTFLVRFSAVLLAPTLFLMAAVATARGVRRPRRMWVGLAMLPVTTLAILTVGYVGGTSLQPLSERAFESRPFRAIQQRLPGLRVPVPDVYLSGFDRQMVESGAGQTPTYLFGRKRDDSPWYYFPVALAVKWPLGFLVALLVRAWTVARRRPRRRDLADEAFVLIPAAIYLAVGMFVANLCIGIRYVLPILPFLCVWCGGLLDRRAPPAPRRAPARPRRPILAVGLAALVAVETALAAPWYLSFFNLAAGGPGNGDRIVNDSNVDWGQGLIALREELARRGIRRIHLVYHGTVDPAIYGIDYVPFLGGSPGAESEWLAVSSYFYVGLSQRLMIREGRTESRRYGFQGWNLAPVARPARCMYLFRLPARPPG